MKILTVDGKEDYGEYGNARCPHCGALGRYVYRFTYEDGSKGGAMAGCIKTIARSPLAIEAQRILDKESEYSSKGWSLPSWDIKIKEIIESFKDGKLSLSQAQTFVNDQKKKAADYRKRNRRW